MEPKKSTKADLVRHKGLFLNIGLTISILMAILAFEWKSYDDSNLMNYGLVQEHIEEVVELPITKQPPPPVPAVKKVNIVEVLDEEVIEKVVEIDLDIEIIEETVIEEIIFEEPIIEEDVDEIINSLINDSEPVERLLISE